MKIKVQEQDLLNEPCVDATLQGVKAQKIAVNLLSETQAAEVLGLTIRCLQAWRVNGRGPKYVRLSRRAVRYRHVDLDDWILSKVLSSTSDVGSRGRNG